MDKGTRIKVKSGPHSGKLGAVFWTGPDKFKGGLRLGVRTDDDETLWLSESEVEASTARASTKPGKVFEKGDRVRFRNNGTEGIGSVFWTGESKQGGQRLGIRDDADPENAVWTDARFAEALNEPGGKPKKASGNSGRSAGKGKAPSRSSNWEDDMPSYDNHPDAMQGLPDGEVPGAPPDFGAPVDDGWLDSMANAVDDDDIPW